ncbi:hypothetical protein DERF_014071 [Dermatophagoides farinae]|uniref:Uncharacterized protein n=1 Tax=Dermatophagoides farinae TaxID=6954 RepID=A0A922HGP5_DERFA|nr:4-coumarate--CoA ligase-like 5 [Dermatophagoides farinae]KAH7639987.1 hypothetical protein HUG17_4020 [Dermatophagoides farinae]KAH9493314.1 hypothetical protein DERF_014071 [Dermatophagoides farinae]
MPSSTEPSTNAPTTAAQPPTNDDPLKLLAQIEIDNDQHIVRNVAPKKMPKFQSVAQFLDNSMKEMANTETIGLIDAEMNTKKLSYKDWYNQSKHFASSLINEYNLKKEETIVFYSENSLDYAITLIGTIFTGCTFTPARAANGKFELTQQIKDCHGSILIIDCKKQLPILEAALRSEQYRQDILENLRLIIIMNENENDNSNNDSEIIKNLETILKDSECKIDHVKQMINNGGDMAKIPHFPVDKDDHFVIIYTSGTTGTPKGAIHSNYSMMGSMGQRMQNSANNDTNQNKMFENFDQKYGLFWYPLCHASGTFIFLLEIINCRTNVLVVNNQLDRLLQLVSEYRVAALSLSPKHVAHMAQNNYHEQFDLNSLKMIWCGGSKVPLNRIENIQKKYKVFYIDGYGTTEFLAGIQNMEFMFGRKFKLGSVGRPSPGAEMKIIDLETGKSLPAEKQGEILLRGPQRFVGYLRNERATNETIDSDGWYHTGDVGYYDDEGYLYIVDRIKEIIKFREYSVFPAEIEEFILKNPAVDSVCVVGVPHKVDGNHIRAYIQICQGQSLSKKEIIDSVQENLGFQKRLRAGVQFVQHVPRTSTDKLDRKYFRSLVKNELLTNEIE